MPQPQFGRKDELDGFRRKAARRVEDRDGRNQMSYRSSEQKNSAKMGHHVGYPTVENAVVGL